MFISSVINYSSECRKVSEKIIKDQCSRKNVSKTHIKVRWIDKVPDKNDFEKTEL